VDRKSIKAATQLKKDRAWILASTTKGNHLEPIQKFSMRDNRGLSFSFIL
jgi:hypothetical protein